jgi:hypothetical protein
MQASRATGTTRVPDMDTADLFNGLFSIYLVGGAMAFFSTLYFGLSILSKTAGSGGQA